MVIRLQGAEKVEMPSDIISTADDSDGAPYDDDGADEEAVDTIALTTDLGQM